MAENVIDADFVDVFGQSDAGPAPAALAVVQAEVVQAEVIPQAETVTVAQAGNGSWGEATHHNLSNGARASGDVHSAHSLLGPADLDWDPEFAPLTAVVGGRVLDVPISVGRGVVRSDTKKPIGVVGARYQLIPHRKLASFADALVGVDGFRLHYGNAGHKHGGARPFIQLKSEPRPLGKVGVTAIDAYDVITLMTGHDGSMQLAAAYGACIICCDNTYAHALGVAEKTGVFIRHTAKGEKMVDEAIRIAERVRELGGSFDNRALQLMTSPFADVLMEKLAVALIPAETTKSGNAREKLLTAYTDAPGAAPGTKWGAAQAVTYYTTHQIGARKDTDRSFNLATGEGTGADMQALAWKYLTTPEGEAELANVKLLTDGKGEEGR